MSVQGEGFVVREFHSFFFTMTSFEVGIHPFEPVVLMLQFFKPLHIRGVQPPYLAFHLHSACYIVRGGTVMPYCRQISLTGCALLTQMLASSALVQETGKVDKLRRRGLDLQVARRVEESWTAICAQHHSMPSRAGHMVESIAELE